MKKLINFILVFSFVFLLTIISVSAETIESSNVSNSTYIIGTHMFTRSTSEGYNGVLTTEHIMLAAKTIEGNSLNDMVIYYKNARGKWTNALTQREVSVPSTFEIDYTNMGVVAVATPSISFSNVSTEYGNKTVYLVIENAEKNAKFEIYGADAMDGEYKLIDTISETNYNMVVALGQNLHVKVRTVKELNNKTSYSEFSNIINLDNSFAEFTAKWWIGEYDNNSATNDYHVVLDGNAPGFEIYYSDSKDGEYLFYEKVLGSETYVNIPVGRTYYFKVRTINEFNNKVYTSEFTDAILRGSWLDLNVTYNIINEHGDRTYIIELEDWYDFDGIEVYKCEEECVLINDSEINQFKVNLLIGEEARYRIIAYKYVGNQKEYYYSYYSTLNNTLKSSFSSIDDRLGTTDNNYETQKYELKVEELGYADGIEVWRSISPDGEYELLDSVEGDTLIIEIPSTITYYYRVRLYKNYNDKIIYSQFDEPIKITNEFLPTVVFTEVKEQLEDGTIKYTISTDDLKGADGILIKYGYCPYEDSCTNLNTKRIYDSSYTFEVLRGYNYSVTVRTFKDGGYESREYETESIANIISYPEHQVTYSGKVDGYDIFNIEVTNLGYDDGIGVFSATDDNYENLTLIENLEGNVVTIKVDDSTDIQYYALKIYNKNGDEYVYGSLSGFSKDFLLSHIPLN